MGTLGMLRPEQVVFYHPLDSDLLEHTIQEVWQGDAASVPGVVGPALSAVTSSDFALGALSTVVEGNYDFQNSPLSIAVMDDTTVVAAWADSVDLKGKARVGIITNGLVSWGPIAVFRAIRTYTHGMRQNEVAAVTPSTVVIGYSKGVLPGGGWVVAGTIVSGNMLVFGDEVQYTPHFQNGEVRTIHVDTDIFAIYSRNGSFGRNDVYVGSVSGTTITVGPQATPNNGGSFSAEHGLDITAVTTTKLVATDEEALIINVGIISGLTTTWGPDTAVANPDLTSQTWIDLERLSDNEVILATTSPWSGGIEIGTISGDTISMTPRQSYHDLRANAVDMALLSPGKVAVTFRDQNNDNRIVMLDVTSGIVTKGPSRIYRIKSRTPIVYKLTDSTFIAGGQVVGDVGFKGDAYVTHGVLDSLAAISGGPLGYPSISGADRIVFSMWSKELTVGSSVVKVERGYNLTIDQNSISFGDTPAVWTGTLIDDLLSTANGLNDELRHMIVLDFEHTTSGSWILKTSMDGLPFVSHGVQDADTQQIMVTDTVPQLSITPGAGETQWIDELIMWGGNKLIFDSFTPEELALSHDLAAIHMRTSSEYQNLFDEQNPPDPDPDPDPDGGLCPAEGDHEFREFTSTRVMNITPRRDGVVQVNISKLFSRNIPFRSEVVKVSAVIKRTDIDAFDGVGGSLKLLIENNLDTDASPSQPAPDGAWETLIEEIECRSIEEGGSCMDAPLDGINVIITSRAIMPRWSSIRATLKGKVDSGYSSKKGAKVQIVLSITILACKHTGGGTQDGVWGSGTIVDQSSP